MHMAHERYAYYAFHFCDFCAWPADARVSLCVGVPHVSQAHTGHTLTHSTSATPAVRSSVSQGSHVPDPRPRWKSALTVSLALLFFFTLLINVTDKPDVVGISATPHTSPLFTCLPWSTACYGSIHSTYYDLFDRGNHPLPRRIHLCA